MRPRELPTELRSLHSKCNLLVAPWMRHIFDSMSSKARKK